MKNALWLWTVGFVLASLLPAGLQAGETKAPPKGPDLEGSIEKLSAEDYRTREKHSRALLLAGKKVIPLLARALKKGEIKKEFRWRALLIIERLKHGPVKAAQKAPKGGRKGAPARKNGARVFTLDPETGELKPAGKGGGPKIDAKMLEALRKQIQKALKERAGNVRSSKAGDKPAKPHEKLLTDHDGSDEF